MNDEFSAKLKNLRQYNRPDLSDFLVHFTGRTRPKSNAVSANFASMSAELRLRNILASRRIYAFEAYAQATVAPVVCFSECTPGGVQTTLRDKLTEPYGIVFRKQTIFDHGGGPVLYVRGDQWCDFVAALSPRLASRLVRFWPGIEGDDAGVPQPIARPSEWTHEREWRLVYEGEAPDDPEWPYFEFSPDDVAALIVPRADLAFAAGYRLLVMSPDGKEVFDESGFWRSA
ncbi:MAG: hypothetical protein ACKVT1_20590 [Dehalococcoidia bacterium]